MLSPLDIARRRFASQYLAEPTLRSPADVVGWLGAVPAQDYLAAKWGVAQRTAEPKDAAVEKALNAGTILRTHVLRPTWHFVRERDIRWMLALTAPRVIAASADYLRKLELDDAVVRRSRTALTKALQGGKHLTRAVWRVPWVARPARVMPDPDPVDAGVAHGGNRVPRLRRHLRGRRSLHPPPRRGARAERHPGQLPQAACDPRSGGKGLT